MITTMKKYVLGYSGLNNYVSFKNEWLKDASEQEKLVGQGMDAAAALIKDGMILAATEEERYTGEKHTGDFPRNSIDFCLRYGGISFDDIGLICHNFNYTPYEVLFRQGDYTFSLYNSILSRTRQVELLAKYFNVKEEDVDKKFVEFSHHECHAAYAFYTSGFKKSLVIVADAISEYSSISVFCGHSTGLHLLKEYGPESSLGMLYSAVTEFLGFVTNSDEYKVMGLAAYGNGAVYSKLFDEIVCMNENGEICIKHLFPEKVYSTEDRDTYRHMIAWLEKKCFKKREKDESIEQCHKDFARALQDKLNEVLTKFVTYWKSITNESNLCMSGGVALNCVANEQIAQRNLFENIYVSPAGGDDGTAIGAAILGALDIDRFEFINKIGMPFYGETISFNTKLLKEFDLIYEEMPVEALAENVADCILEGGIVAIARDRMEFGPRALGNRSILADPRYYSMRERLNCVTKQREQFRPFAPMIKDDAKGKYFLIQPGVIYKHMLFNASVREEHRSQLQAITHIDGTARVQTVEKEELPFIWEILDNIEKKIGMPILLNTSFNLKQKPIVCTAKNALEAFVESDIDMLVLQNFLIRKRI